SLPLRLEVVRGPLPLLPLEDVSVLSDDSWDTDEEIVFGDLACSGFKRRPRQLVLAARLGGHTAGQDQEAEAGDGAEPTSLHYCFAPLPPIPANHAPASTMTATAGAMAPSHLSWGARPIPSGCVALTPRD